jgi:multiple sugar transport system substrate-binding protein
MVANHGSAGRIGRLAGREAGQLSRRAVLGLMGAAGVGFATGCQLDTGQSESGANPGGSNPKAINFPDFDTELPSEDVTFRWVDSGDLKSVWEQSVLDAFTEKHANIKTQYDGSGWDTVNTVVPLGIRNGSAHDVFALPQEVPPQVAINEGWVQPLEEIIPDFEAWKKNFPESALVPGVNIFDDKLYSWPISSSRRLTFMSMYDTANMAEAGYDDPGAQITTWDEMLEALAAVKKAGKVGLMFGGDSLDDLIYYLAFAAGWQGMNGAAASAGMDLSSGERIHAADEMVAAYEFIAKIVKDKLIVPGYLNTLQADARAQMTAQGAGMIFNGPWDIPAWKETAPDWKYSIGPLPTAEGEPYLVPFFEGANSSWVYAETKLPTVAGQILSYMGSPDGQKMMVILSEGNLQSLQPEANEAAANEVELDPNAQFATDLAKDLMRIAPRPELKNPDTAKVNLELKPVTPTWEERIQGLLIGDLTNPKKEFAKYDADLDAALDTAIAAAKKKGSSVTRDDYTFSNWDRTKDYTIDMYESA